MSICKAEVGNSLPKPSAKLPHPPEARLVLVVPIALRQAAQITLSNYASHKF